MPPAPRPELMALLADVKQNPDDLTPWLVLCDWLEDQEDEADRSRGEYCRLCFDKLGKKTYASDWEKGERRRHLYRKHHDAWFGPVGPIGPEIRKGLLEVRTQDLLFYAKSLQGSPESWAWVTSLRVWEGVGALTNPEHCWLLEGLSSLDVMRDLGGEARVAKFVECPALRGIRSLYLRMESLSRAKAARITASPHLADVKSLSIDLQCFRRPSPRQPPRRERAEARQLLRDRFGDRVAIIGAVE